MSFLVPNKELELSEKFQSWRESMKPPPLRRQQPGLLIQGHFFCFLEEISLKMITKNSTDSRPQPWQNITKPPQLQRHQAGFLIDGNFYSFCRLKTYAGAVHSVRPRTAPAEFHHTTQHTDLELTTKDGDDAMLASLLQEEEDKRASSQLEKRVYMLSTKTGRAFLFVKAVIDVVEQVGRTVDHNVADKINAIATDDLVFLTENMLDAQDSFRMDGKPYTIDLGYHNTTKKNLERIKTDGLLTKKERTRFQIYSSYRGSYFGDGVYTANNPVAFKSFGDTGLLVARLQGRSVWLGAEPLGSTDKASGFDTIIGNKHASSPVAGTSRMGDIIAQHEEIVLRSSSQTLPLIKFSTTLLPNLYVERAHAESPILKFQLAMAKLVEEFFNNHCCARQS